MGPRPATVEVPLLPVPEEAVPLPGVPEVPAPLPVLPDDPLPAVPVLEPCWPGAVTADTVPVTVDTTWPAVDPAELTAVPSAAPVLVRLAGARELAGCRQRPRRFCTWSEAAGST